MDTLTIEQMKRVEEQAVEMGVSYLQLMENAGTVCAFNIVRENTVLNRHCVLLCGSGNNGGDGFVIARRLYEKGAKVSVILVKSLPATETAYRMFTKITDTDIEIIDSNEDLELTKHKLKQADIIVDCIFGTGFKGDVVGNIKNVIQYSNLSFAKKYSVDIPSGLNGDSGKGDVYFAPDITIALGAYKKAHILAISKEKCGHIIGMDIGIPRDAFDNLDYVVVKVTRDVVKNILPKKNPYSHKGDYGKLLNISGSIGMGGAAIMSTKSALRCGAGLVTLATPKDIVLHAFTHILEAVTIPLNVSEQGSIDLSNMDILQQRLDSSSACLIGCGLGSEAKTKVLVRQLLKNTKTTIILDADGINAIADNININILKTVNCNVIVTPHLGEMSRLTGLTIDHIQKNREQVAVDFAKEYKVYVILKGHETLTVTPDGKIYKNTTGNAGMAKGGSGDVLAGMVSAFVAQSIDIEKACILAVYLHGLAGDNCAYKYSEYSMIASDIIDEIPLLLADLTNK